MAMSAATPTTPQLPPPPPPLIHSATFNFQEEHENGVGRLGLLASSKGAFVQGVKESVRTPDQVTRRNGFDGKIRLVTSAATASGMGTASSDLRLVFNLKSGP